MFCIALFIICVPFIGQTGSRGGAHSGPMRRDQPGFITAERTRYQEIVRPHPTNDRNEHREQFNSGIKTPTKHTKYTKYTKYAKYTKYIKYTKYELWTFDIQ